MQRRPHPFKSVEGCFLSRTVGALMFLVGFALGAAAGYLIAGDNGYRWGAAVGAVLVGWTPWRRWVVRFIKDQEAKDQEAG